MKLIKYLFWVLLLMGGLIFLVEFNKINQFDNNTPLVIKIPFLGAPSYENGFEVWIVLVITLTVGVVIGFFIAFFQIFAQKKRIYSLKSKLRRIQLELNSLRNQSVEDDDMDIVDEINDSIL